MTPQEHYLEAERLLEVAKGDELGSQNETYCVAAAQVHATLATAQLGVRMFLGSDEITEGSS